MTLTRIVSADKGPVVKEKINAIMDEVESGGSGSGDMLKSTYDPANGSRQVAFSDEIPTLTSELTNNSGFITSAPVTSVNGRTGVVTGLAEASDIPDTSNFETTTQLNARDTANRARTNHTGTQLANTISNFQTTVSSNTNVTANTTARHTHANKALLDTYTNTNADISDAISKEHTHTNKAILDATTASYTSAEESKLTGIEVGAEVNTVTSVNSQTGLVSLDTDDISEGVNKYDKIVGLLAGAGISVTGTYPNFTVTNTSPDQVVALTAGTNVSITGTYPNFTINADGGTAPVTSVNGRTGVVVGLAEASDIPNVSNFETTTQLNSRDTANRNRANHTGSQAISTVTGLQTELNGKEPTFTKNTAFNKNFGTTTGTVTQGDDSRLTNSREWTATTIAQAEAETGTATTRRAFTAQRVRQSVIAWWNTITLAISDITGLQTELNAKANSNAVVDLSTAQTVAGVKTFSSSPIVPTPTTDFQTATKKYVDDNAGGGGGGGGGAGIMKLYNPIGTGHKSCPYTIGCLNQPTFVIAERVYYIPFCLGFNKTFTEIGLSVVTNNGGEGRLGLYTVNNGRPDDLVFETDIITLTVGYHSEIINFEYTAGDVYMLAFLGVSTTLRGISGGGVQQILPNATAVVTQSHYWEDRMMLFGDLPQTAGTLNVGTGTVPAIYLQ